MGGTGTQTATLSCGGGPPFSPSPGGGLATTEEYNGTAWTEQGVVCLLVFGTARYKQDWNFCSRCRWFNWF